MLKDPPIAGPIINPNPNAWKKKIVNWRNYGDHNEKPAPIYPKPFERSCVPVTSET